MDIRVDNLKNPKVIALIREHLASMAPTAPPESRHALDLEGLRDPDITFWAMWNGAELAGIGALKRLSQSHAEVKSMRTAKPFLRQGVASRLLTHIVRESEACGYKQLSLETGSMDYFEPARQLYASFGFIPCPPFGGYVEDENSVFMTKHIGQSNRLTSRSKPTPKSGAV